MANMLIVSAMGSCASCKAIPIISVAITAKHPKIPVAPVILYMWLIFKEFFLENLE
jgi:hypothetical protein